MEKFRSFDGVELAYTDSGGEGEPLVLLHGFTTSSRQNWEDTGVYGRLAGSGRRVIMLDARGHGESEKPYTSYSYWNRAMARDVNALAEQLGLFRYDLLGYSMGAKVAIEAAVMYTGAIRSLTLAGFSVYDQEWQLSEADRRARVEELLAGKLREKEASANAWAGAEGDRKAFAARLEGAIFPEYTSDDLRHLRIPVLVINGGEEYDAEKAASCFPNARGVTLRGDHVAFLTDEGFVKEVLSFLTDEAGA